MQHDKNKESKIQELKQMLKNNKTTLKTFEKTGITNKTVPITIIDAICGKGKTQFSYQNIKDNITQKFIYVTLYVSETQRLLKFCETEGIQIQTPKEIYDKNTKTKNKSNGLRVLLQQGSNIVMTHELFKIINEDVLYLIEKYDYVLYLDEVMDLIHPYRFLTGDLYLLLLNGILNYDLQGKLLWKESYFNYYNQCMKKMDSNCDTSKNTYVGVFNDLKAKCENNSLYLFMFDNKDNKTTNTEIVYIFPPKIFTSFKHIYVLTYMFEAQLQSVYFKLILNEYELKTVNYNTNLDRYELKDYDVEEAKQEFNSYKDIMNIYQGKYNDIGKKTNYSYTYLHKCDLTSINKIMRNIKERVWKVGTEEILWTTIKGTNEKIKKELSKQGFKSNFIPMNMRATNDYRYKTHLMYIYNRYMKPDLKMLFKTELNEDIYALSDLVQWIFRSAIRDDKPINLFLPSERMRNLIESSDFFFDLMYKQYIEKQDYIKNQRIYILTHKIIK